jgi:DNA-binding IclR family transcriptional regulator
MLAFMPEAERDAVIAGMMFERFQPWTISNRKDFLKCLEDVRKKGWAVDAGEHLEGHHCLGAPILFDHHSHGRSRDMVFCPGFTRT